MGANLYTRKGFYATISGFLLIITGAHSFLRNILKLVELAEESGILERDLSILIMRYLPFIIILSGLMVITGGLIYIFFGKKFYASFLISFGSGASIVSLFLTVISTGPTFKLYLLKLQLDRISDIGIIYILSLLAIILAYAAIIDDFFGFAITFLSAFSLSISLSIESFPIILRIIKMVKFLERITKSVTFIFLVLPIVLVMVASILYGYKKYLLGFILLILSLALVFLPILAIILTFFIDLIGIIKLVASTLGLILLIISILYGTKGFK